MERGVAFCKLLNKGFGNPCPVADALSTFCSFNSPPTNAAREWSPNFLFQLAATLEFQSKLRVFTTDEVPPFAANAGILAGR